MSDPVEDLMADLLAWLAPAPRPYGEVMEAWRTSCPRLTVWENVIEAGLVARRPGGGAGPLIALTDDGRAWLAARDGSG